MNNFFSIIGQDIARQIEQMQGHINICWPPHENKYIAKRKRGVILYTKPRIERDKPKKEVQFNRRLCTAAYR